MSTIAMHNRYIPISVSENARYKFILDEDFEVYLCITITSILKTFIKITNVQTKSLRKMLGKRFLHPEKYFNIDLQTVPLHTKQHKLPSSV
jgi:hypothetical protein